jgi:hypothetical protein
MRPQRSTGPRAVKGSMWLPAPPAPSTLPQFYRYGSTRGERLGWLERIIKGSTVYVPEARELNDPEDCRPRIGDLSVDRYVRFIRDRISPPAHGLSEAQVRQTAEHFGPDQIRRELEKLLRDELEHTRVYSLSKRCDISRMWRMYARLAYGVLPRVRKLGSFRICSRGSLHRLSPNDRRQ